MSGTTTYPSKFYKAENRLNCKHVSCQSFVTTWAEKNAVKDCFLPAGATTELPIATGARHILFPVVGALVLLADSETETILMPGELYLVPGNLNTIKLKNPFPDEQINFLLLDIAIVATATQSIAQLDITTKNNLVPGSGFAQNIKVGVYDSRTKDALHLQPTNDATFVYIINGSFEVAERLMEYRDGLFLWEIKEVDFEALSETAIVLFIECSTT